VEPPVGGVSRYCRALADLLGGGDAALQLDLTKTSSSELGIQRSVVQRGIKRVMGPRVYALRAAVAECAPGLVVDNHPFLWQEPGYAALPRGIVRCPWVLVIHDGAFPELLRRRTAGGAALRDELGWIAGAVCMSEPILEALVEVAPAVRAMRLSPLLADVTPEPEGPVDGPVRAFFARHEVVISTSGGLGEHYGVGDVLRAFAELRSRGRDVGVVLLLGSFIHEEPVAAQLREATARWGDDHVLALTDVPDGAAVIARSDVYVRPSRVDSFGLALYEAMLTGVPTVAARHPTRPEGTLLYDPGDVAGLVSTLELARSPRILDEARARVDEVRAQLQQNRQETLAFLDACRD
jgi:glycosyltransferase involved in cell wall biosynthesis